MKYKNILKFPKKAEKHKIALRGGSYSLVITGITGHIDCSQCFCFCPAVGCNQI